MLQLENLNPQERAIFISLAQRVFTGDPKRYSYICGSRLTTGAQWFAQAARCYWLFDLITLAQDEPKLCAQPWQVWKIVLIPNQGLERDQQPGAIVSAENIDGQPLYIRAVPYTDFPLDKFELLACRQNAAQPGAAQESKEEDQEFTIMLPSEI